MINPNVFLVLSGLHSKRLRLRYVGFLLLILIMALLSFGCSGKGKSETNPCGENYHEYTDPNTGQKQCVQAPRGNEKPKEKPPSLASEGK